MLPPSQPMSLLNQEMVRVVASFFEFLVVVDHSCFQSPPPPTSGLPSNPGSEDAQ